MVALTTQPKFKAKKGTLKARVAEIPSELDFFGNKWARAMDKFLDAAEGIKVDAKETFIVLVADLFDRVQIRTPVDTGAARAGWQLDWNSDFTEGVLFNTVPYIVYLEFGSSKKAPSGMLRVSLNEMALQLRKATKELAA